MARTYPNLVTPNSIASSDSENNEVRLNLQHILGFLLDGETLDDITTPREMHDFKERVAPSTPSSGVLAMYADSADGVLKVKNDAGGVDRIGNGQWIDVALSSGQFDITLTNYPEFTGCKTLEIEVGLRSSVSATSDSVYCYLQGDFVASNYHRQVAGAQDGAELEAYNNIAQICACTGATSPSDSFTEGRIVIGGMDKTVMRLMRFNGGGRYESAKLRNEQSIVTWTATTSITRVTIRPLLYSTNTFHSSSWCRLHFIK